MTLKISISRSNFISTRSEDFKVFSYVIWWTEYEKNTENNHWGILDLENLQSRSHFIFCISESCRWLSSVIDLIKMEKTVKKILKASLTLKMSISRWNFGFQNKRSELQPHIWRLHKILRYSFSAWSKINDVNAKYFFFFAISVWELVHGKKFN